LRAKSGGFTGEDRRVVAPWHRDPLWLLDLTAEFRPKIALESIARRGGLRGRWTAIESVEPGYRHR
jgi:hypothetical protein